MPDTKQYDVVVKVCDFKTPSKSAVKVINGPYMKEHVIDNPNWRVKLDRGMIAGLFTHKDRQPRFQTPEIPYEDNILVSPYLCNIAKNVWIENDELKAGLMIQDQTQFGKVLKDMLKNGINMPVSMSVKAHTDSKYYYVDDLLGIDFTMKPDLEAKVLEVNFSNNEERPNAGIYHFSHIIEDEDIQVNFDDSSEDSKKNNIQETIELDGGSESTEKVNNMDPSGVDKMPKDENGEMVVKSDNKGEIENKGSESSVTTSSPSDSANETIIKGKDGSAINKNGDNNQDVDEKDSEKPEENLKDAINESEFSIIETKIMNTGTFSFSLVQYLKELKYAPHIVLKNRIKEVIRYCNFTKQNKIDENADLIKAYIDTYVMQWIQGIFNDPDSQFNIILGLRLNLYVQDRQKLIKLNRVMTKVRQQLQQTGLITNALQKEVNRAYQEVLGEIYNYINSKLSFGRKLN